MCRILQTGVLYAQELLARLVNIISLLASYIQLNFCNTKKLPVAKLLTMTVETVDDQKVRNSSNQKYTIQWGCQDTGSKDCSSRQMSFYKLSSFKTVPVLPKSKNDGRKAAKHFRITISFHVTIIMLQKLFNITLSWFTWRIPSVLHARRTFRLAIQSTGPPNLYFLFMWYIGDMTKVAFVSSPIHQAIKQNKKSSQKQGILQIAIIIYVQNPYIYTYIRNQPQQKIVLSETKVIHFTARLSNAMWNTLLKKYLRHGKHRCITKTRYYKIV